MINCKFEYTTFVNVMFYNFICVNEVNVNKNTLIIKRYKDNEVYTFNIKRVRNLVINEL